VSTTRFRIPRVTAAILVLGGACGDGDGNKDGGIPLGGGDGDGDGDVDGGGDGDGDGDGDVDAGTGTGGTDVSTARMAKIAEGFCRQYADCDPEGFASYYDSEPDCVSDNKAFFSEYATAYGTDCADAILDVLACSNELTCTQDPADECQSAGRGVIDNCPEEITDGVVAAGKSAKSKSARLRIPR
jgi:hypothetical protein